MRFIIQILVEGMRQDLLIDMTKYMLTKPTDCSACKYSVECAENKERTLCQEITNWLNTLYR